MPWEFELYSRTGTPLGTLEDWAEGSERSIRPRPVNRIPSFQWTLPTRHRFARRLLDLDENVVVGWLDGEAAPRFCGPVVTFQKSVSEQAKTVTFVAHGAAWRLGLRLFGKSKVGFSMGSAVSPADSGAIAVAILNQLNAGGNTGIRVGNITASSSTYVRGWRYTPGLEGLSELAAPLNGPDWWIEPVEPYSDALGVVYGLLHMLPALGSLNPRASWEYGGTRRNVREFSHAGDASGLANTVHVLPPGFPSGTGGVVTATNAPSILARGLFEVALGSEQQVADFRTKLGQEHVRVRKTPRQVLGFTPVREGLDALGEGVPRYGLDWIEGDIVPFTATELFPGAVEGAADEEIVTVDADFRIHGADLALDEFGGATPTLALIEET